MFLTFLLFLFIVVLFFHKQLDYLSNFLPKEIQINGSKPKKIDYKAYINSDAWRKKAKRIRRRDGLRCRLCNTSNTELHVHHSTYERLGFEDDNDLITLCKNCHQKFHDLNL